MKKTVKKSLFPSNDIAKKITKKSLSKNDNIIKKFTKKSLSESNDIFRKIPKRLPLLKISKKGKFGKYLVKNTNHPLLLANTYKKYGDEFIKILENASQNSKKLAKKININKKILKLKEFKDFSIKKMKLINNKNISDKILRNLNRTGKYGFKALKRISDFAKKHPKLTIVGILYAAYLTDSEKFLNNIDNIMKSATKFTVKTSGQIIKSTLLGFKSAIMNLDNLEFYGIFFTIIIFFLWKFKKQIYSIIKKNSISKTKINSTYYQTDKNMKIKYKIKTIKEGREKKMNELKENKKKTDNLDSKDKREIFSKSKNIIGITILILIIIPTLIIILILNSKNNEKNKNLPLTDERTKKDIKNINNANNIFTKLKRGKYEEISKYINNLKSENKKEEILKTVKSFLGKQTDSLLNSEDIEIIEINEILNNYKVFNMETAPKYQKLKSYKKKMLLKQKFNIFYEKLRNENDINKLIKMIRNNWNNNYSNRMKEKVKKILNKKIIRELKKLKNDLDNQYDKVNLLKEVNEDIKKHESLLKINIKEINYSYKEENNNDTILFEKIERIKEYMRIIKSGIEISEIKFKVIDKNIRDNFYDSTGKLNLKITFGKQNRKPYWNEKIKAESVYIDITKKKFKYKKLPPRTYSIELIEYDLLDSNDVVHDNLIITEDDILKLKNEKNLKKDTVNKKIKITIITP